MKNCSKCGTKKELGRKSSYCRDCAREYKRKNPNIYPPAYRTWVALRRRCDDKKQAGYKNYGGRGIKYDQRWHSYFNFWEDMGSTYQSGLSLDRIDVDGDYCKENCRWSTAETQARNRQNRKWHLTINDVSKPFIQWCEELGIDYHKARDRVYRGETMYNSLFPV